MNDFENDNFYWAKIRYNLDPEPLIRWEVLHFEDDHWWAAAHRGPFPTEDILEVRSKLERPE